MAKWDTQREDETHKSWMAFQKYRDMSPHDRSLAKLATSLGYSSKTTLEQWSTKYDWVDRAQAYDNYMSEKSLALREGNLVEYQSILVENESQISTQLLRLIAKEIERLLVAQQEGKPVDSKDIQRLVSSLQKTSNVSRRAAKLPTTYRADTTDEYDEEQTVFVFGDE